MSKHTPGPWRVTEGRRIDSGRGYSTAIADVWAHGEGADDAPSTGEAEANARLLAAAPDLLEACKEAVAVANMSDEDKPTLDDIDWARLRAAIAKAEGN